MREGGGGEEVRVNGVCSVARLRGLVPLTKQALSRGDPGPPWRHARWRVRTLTRLEGRGGREGYDNDDDDDTTTLQRTLRLKDPKTIWTTESMGMHCRTGVKVELMGWG